MSGQRDCQCQERVAHAQLTRSYTQVLRASRRVSSATERISCCSGIGRVSSRTYSWSRDRTRPTAADFLGGSTPRWLLQILKRTANADAGPADRNSGSHYVRPGSVLFPSELPSAMVRKMTLSSLHITSADEMHTPRRGTPAPQKPCGPSLKVAFVRRHNGCYSEV